MEKGPSKCHLLLSQIFLLFHKQIQGNLKENLVVNQTSLRAFFHAPFNLFQEQCHVQNVCRPKIQKIQIVPLIKSDLICTNLFKFIDFTSPVTKTQIVPHFVYSK